MHNFLISIVLIAQLLGITLPQAITEKVSENIYLVPTTVDLSLEMRVMEPIRTEYNAPKKKNDDFAPDIDARSAVIIDAETKQILWQKNPDLVMPFASITKLMTALVWLDNQPPEGFNHVHTFAPEEDTIDGKELNLSHGEKLTAFDLLRSSIVGSDNDTTLALVHTTEMSDEDFIKLMNNKAQALSMENTTFVDPTGLSAKNISTSYDIALLALEAFSKPDIQQPASMKEHLQETVDTKKITRVLTTDILLYDPELQIVGGKTGYTTEAGYCLVTQARVPNSDRNIIGVVLGVSTDQGRFDQMKKLLLWTFDNYSWE